MPELPEVQTTVNGLKAHIVGLHITDAWSDYSSVYFKGSETIKDPTYFKTFKKEVINRTVVGVERRAKNILIRLDNHLIILVHMKMTGHLLYGTYKFHPELAKDPWEPLSPESLKDSFNRRVHFLLSFDNGHHLALSDMRKFAKVTLVDSRGLETSLHLGGIGPEPLENDFDFEKFKTRLLLRPNGKIKQVLMDQKIVAGIGNIYADESLWRAGINPLERVGTINEKRLKELFAAIKQTLARGIDFGGDSTSDYRNVLGEKGKFHESHRAYQRTGEKCQRKGCKGKIVRVVLGGRSAHFCDVHQKLRTQ
ncbi:MAG: bifunctional DNA-formamidopyrimidine glycosylase/DNA-(apurinic or apyrimidinic site) lyase [Patescibacteria group bacterium]